MEITTTWGGSTLTSNNTDLKTKAIKKHTHNIMIKRSI